MSKPAAAEFKVGEIVAIYVVDHVTYHTIVERLEFKVFPSGVGYRITPEVFMSGFIRDEVDSVLLKKAGKEAI